MYSGRVEVKERGGCLSIYLTVLICASTFVLFYSLANPGWMLPYIFSRVISPLVIPIASATVICARAVWNWKLWGVHGLYGLMIFDNGLQIILNANNAGTYLIALIIQPLILWLLVRNKMDWFE